MSFTVHADRKLYSPQFLMHPMPGYLIHGQSSWRILEENSRHHQSSENKCLVNVVNLGDGPLELKQKHGEEFCWFLSAKNVVQGNQTNDDSLYEEECTARH
jgi:hypothetical protein